MKSIIYKLFFDDFDNHFSYKSTKTLQTFTKRFNSSNCSAPESVMFNFNEANTRLSALGLLKFGIYSQEVSEFGTNFQL